MALRAGGGGGRVGVGQLWAVGVFVGYGSSLIA